MSDQTACQGELYQLQQRHYCRKKLTIARINQEHVAHEAVQRRGRTLGSIFFWQRDKSKLIDRVDLR